MSDEPHRAVSDADWNQLMTLAAGYLVLEDGDVKASMARALIAHTELIKALKAGRIQAKLKQGLVTMFVPEEGGVALRMERFPQPAPPPVAPPPPVQPPDDPPTVTDSTPPPSNVSTFIMDEDEF